MARPSGERAAYRAQSVYADERKDVVERIAADREVARRDQIGEVEDRRALSPGDRRLDDPEPTENSRWKADRTTVADDTSAARRRRVGHRDVEIERSLVP